MWTLKFNYSKETLICNVNLQRSFYEGLGLYLPVPDTIPPFSENAYILVLNIINFCYQC